MSLIETVAESPVSAVIAASTVGLAMVHEMALAAHTQTARRLARMLWGPLLVFLILFAMVAIARVAWIF